MKFLSLVAVLTVCFQCSSSEFFNVQRRKKDTSRIPRRCGVKILPVEYQKHCVAQRELELKIARAWYQITDEMSQQTIRFPLTHIPWLNQTIERTVAYYATDDFEASYFATFQFYITTIGEAILNEARKRFNDLPFESHKEFLAVRRFTELFLKTQVKIPLFDNPSAHSDFTDHLSTLDWQTDADFSQRRVAGQCPFTLRKIVNGGQNIGIKLCNLKKVMNPQLLSMKFNTGNDEWTFQEAVDDGRLFVQYYEQMDNVQTDFPDRTPVKGKKMRPVVSTLTFFILNDEGHLDVVAIQTDSKPSAPVYTTKSPIDEWRIAKILADSVQEAYCQSYVHLGHIHFYGTIFCLSFQRHLSQRHPLFDFFKFHCEGTVLHISTVYSTLSAPDSVGDLYYTMGNEGFVQLSNQAFLDRQYGRFDFVNIINNNGLDDPRIKYYPFRDDVKLILAEYKTFARRLTNIYYKRGYLHKKDLTPKDSELQNWAQELSEGIGQVPGFPKNITNHKILEEFIVRFLWLNVIHASSNYAMAANFLPTAAPKVYEADGNGTLSPDQVFFNASSATEYTIIRDRLINFRVNKIFDYSDRVKDWRLRELVRQTHYRLHNCVQKTLATRNSERKKLNQLGYQFIEPKWLTNSVHI